MIPYHGSPMSGDKFDRVKFFSGRHAMVSFACTSDLALIADVCKTFCIDNGAFSIWNKGGTIDLEKYYTFLREWHLHPAYDFCLIPDVIAGNETDNMELLKAFPKDIKRGVPVWHLHESLEYLEYMIENYDMIALGSSGDYSCPNTSKWWERINEAFSVICDDIGRPKVRIHGLRMLNPDVFTRLPFYSTDSTNAVRNASSLDRFGQYKPPSYWQRAEVIAERIEIHQSAPVYIKQPIQQELF